MKGRLKPIVAVLCMAFWCVPMVTGCKAEKTKVETTDAAKETSAYAVEDLTGVVDGIKDHYVLQDAKDIDPAYGIKVNTEIVKDITVDDSKVNYTKTGTYPVTYTVVVDNDAMEAHQNKESETPVAETVQETESESISIAAHDIVKESILEKETSTEVMETVDKENTSAIVIETTFEVVDKEKAETLVQKGEQVWADKNGFVGTAKETESAKETGETKVEDKNTESKKEESSKSSEESSKANTSSSKPTTGNTSSGNANSGNNQTPVVTPPTVTPPAETKPAETSHVHQWQEVSETIHHDSGYYTTESVCVQDAWDEPVYGAECNACFAHFATADEAIDHDAFECGAGYATGIVIDTIHHDAVYENRDVWVDNSWDETITTTVCSSCGQTK